MNRSQIISDYQEGKLSVRQQCQLRRGHPVQVETVFRRAGRLHPDEREVLLAQGHAGQLDADQHFRKHQAADRPGLYLPARQDHLLVP